MNNRNLINILSIMAVFIMGTTALNAHDFEVDGIYYKINGTAATVTHQGASPYSANSYSGDVTIPATVTYNGTTYPVTTIGDYAFSGCIGLTSIEIPNSVTSIGNWAFDGCYALTSIDIPESVTTIHTGAFSYCHGLTSITLPNSVNYIDSYAFNGCYGLTSIVIPNSVNYIGDGAFSRCSELTEISVDSGNTTYDSRNDCNGIIETASNTLIAGCVNTVIPNTVKVIHYAFYGCRKLNSIDIPESVTTISDNAFSGCVELTSIEIPNSVTSIGNWAFDGCYALTSIDIPESVTTIHTGAFDYCFGLTTITIPNSVNYIDSYAFDGCDGLKSIVIPNSVNYIGDGAFSGCSELTEISVDSGNTTYDSRNDCNGIIETASNTLIAGCVNTVIPNTVKVIHYAFSGCRKLNNIDIPESVTTIGDNAFSGCVELTSIEIPNSVTSIGDWAFDGCFGLTSIDIPESVTTIHTGAFEYCFALTTITLPNSVNYIDSYAFTGCTSLKTVTCLATIPPDMVDSSCFSDETYSNASLQVPFAVIDAYRTTDYWNLFQSIVSSETFEVDGIYYRATSESTATVIHSDEGYCGDVVIPESVLHDGSTYSVTAIEANAFAGDQELTTVVIGDAVEAIGKAAFQGCTGLTRVTIGCEVKLIKEKAFDECDSLAMVICDGLTPPVMVSSDCFTSTAYNQATLRVAHEAVEAYSTADYWNLFATIKGYGTAGPGDVDGDGQIGINDVTTLIDAMLGSLTELEFMESADLNGNGRIDIGDVTTLIDMMLNNNP